MGRGGRRQAAGLDEVGVAVVLQAASLLLEYPGAAAPADAELIAAALAEQRPARPCQRLREFLDWWRAQTPSEREQAYVATFDLRPELSLYLTQALPGPPKERGRELLSLRERYRAAGIRVAADELPDYLPLLLEVAAAEPACRPMLAVWRESLERLRRNLAVIESPFHLVVAAVLDLAHPVAAAPRPCGCAARSDKAARPTPRRAAT
jgi:nitrate reductase delta subunit